MTAAAPAEALKCCKGPLCIAYGSGTLKPLVEFHKDGHGGHRSMCKRCTNHLEVQRYQADRANIDTRICDECGEEKPLESFAELPRRRRSWRSRTCMTCEGKHIDPLAEAEAELAEGLRMNRRDSVALNLTLGMLGLTLREYKALRGWRRMCVDAWWTGHMRALAIEAGEYIAPIPDPNLINHPDHADVARELSRQEAIYTLDGQRRRPVVAA